MLNAEMTTLIKQNTIGCVATVTTDGRPAVSPKGTFIVVDDTTIAFSHIRSRNTVNNIQAGSGAVEVNFLDVLSRKACRVRGRATYTPMNAAMPRLVERFTAMWPDLAALMHGIVTIDIDHAELLTSPSYDIGADTDELVDHWLRQYANMAGYTVAKRPDAGAPSTASGN